MQPSPLGGRGIFAATEFDRLDAIGFYTGFVLGRRGDARADAQADELEQGGNTMLMTIQGVYVDGSRKPQPRRAQETACGRFMFPPRAWPGAFLHFVNSNFDAATGRPVHDRINCQVDPNGMFVAIRKIRVGEELIIDYGAEYYREMVERGTSAAPIML